MATTRRDDIYFTLIEKKKSLAKDIEARFDKAQVKSNGGRSGQVLELSDEAFKDIIHYGVIAQVLGSETNKAKELVEGDVTYNSSGVAKKLVNLCSQNNILRSMTNQLVSRYLQLEMNKILKDKKNNDSKKIETACRDNKIIGIAMNDDNLMQSIISNFKLAPSAPTSYYIHSLLIPTRTEIWVLMLRDAQNTTRPQYANFIFGKVCKGIRVVLNSQPTLDFEKECGLMEELLNEKNEFRSNKPRAGSEILEQRRISDNLFQIKNSLTTEANTGSKKALDKMIKTFKAVDTQTKSAKLGSPSSSNNEGTEEEKKPKEDEQE